MLYSLLINDWLITDQRLINEKSMIIQLEIHDKSIIDDWSMTDKWLIGDESTINQ